MPPSLVIHEVREGGGGELEMTGALSAIEFVLNISIVKIIFQLSLIACLVINIVLHIST